MSYINAYIHLVWSTKNRYPFLNSEELRNKVWFHILENARDNGIHIDFVNGHKDHCHCLLSMNHNISIGKAAQLIKGESSFWINDKSLCIELFEWQDEYFATSVSPRDVSAVREYIRNQEEHHRIVSFEDEYKKLTRISKPLVH